MRGERRHDWWNEAAPRADDDRRRAMRRFVLAGLVALAIHLLVIPPALWLLPEPEAAPPPRRSVSLSFFERQARLLEALRYEPSEEIPEGQVADVPVTERTRTDEPDPEARFLSEAAARVERETQARGRVAGAHRVAPRPGGPQGRQGRRSGTGVIALIRPQGPGAGDAAAAGDHLVLAPAGGAPDPAGLPLPDGGETGIAPVGPRAPDTAATPLARGADGTSPLPPGDALVPSLDVLADAVVGSGIDRLDGVELGDDTALSSRPFAHAGFYRRVRDRVAQFWDPPGAFARYDPTGSAYGYRDRETVVLVKLDCTGRLLDTFLVRESGARFLDEEAVDAIAEAAPFYNPPRELCDARRDLITFTFGFYVETDGGPTLRVRLQR
jgi:TonB family protein